MKRLHDETQKRTWQTARRGKKTERMLKLKRRAPVIRVSLIGVWSETRFWLAFEIRVIARFPTYGRRES